MSSSVKSIFLIVLISCSMELKSQIRVNQIGGQDNPITVAVPFVSFAPDLHHW
jgi:hypothetical protein